MRCHDERDGLHAGATTPAGPSRQLPASGSRNESVLLDDAERLLAAADERETTVQEIVLAQRLLFVGHTVVVQIHATGLDGLAGLGNRLEQACLHPGLGDAVVDADGRERLGTGLVLYLESVDGGFKRVLVDGGKVAAAPEQGCGRVDRRLRRGLAMHEAGHFPCEGLRVRRDWCAILRRVVRSRPLAGT